MADGDGFKDQSVALIPSQFNFIRLNLGYTPPSHIEGLIFYDNENKTISLMTSVPGVVLQIGQEQYLRARNDQGAQINNGQAIYISGSAGDIANVKLAKADAMPMVCAVALATENVAIGEIGFFTTFGIVRDIDTSGLSVGDVWLSPTIAGGLTNIKPTAPDIPVLIGCVINVHAIHGQVLVNIVRSI